MKTLCYTLTLEVLTPVHVGSGETVYALEYLRDGNTLHVVHPDRWTNWLEQQPERAQRYIDWVEATLQADPKKLALTGFVRNRLKIADPGAVAKQVRRYAVQMEGCYEPPAERGFRAHLRDGQNRAYLPGSSLKGAIRTALLEDILLDEHNLNRLLIQPLQQVQAVSNPNERREVNKLRQALRGVWQRMEQEALRGGEQKANYDLLRFVLVSDSEPFAPDMVSLRLVRSEGTNRNTDTWIEAIRPGACTRFTLCFQPDAPLAQLGLAEELDAYLQCETLLEVLAERAERRLQPEQAYPYPPAVQKVLEDLLERNRPDAPLLCVGWGQGYLGTTVMGLVQDEQPKEYQRQIEKMKPALPRLGQGVQPSRFPKTRRAVRDGQGSALFPLGWVQLRVEEAPESASD